MKRIVFALVIMSLTGCVQRIVDFTVISTKNIPLSRSAEFTRVDGRVIGEDSRMILILPLGLPSAKEAVDRAIESTPGCVALADGVLEQHYFSLLIGYITYQVKGTCLLDPQLVQQSPSRKSLFKSGDL